MGRGWEGKTGLDDVLDAVIRELGSPRTLREVGVGREKLDGLAVAENRLRDGSCRTRPVLAMEKGLVLAMEKGQVLEILGGGVGVRCERA